MASLALRSARLAETLPGSSCSGARLLRIGQTRSYAQQNKKKPVKKISGGFKPNNNAVVKKIKKDGLGAFMPLSINQLSDPVFAVDRRVELKLPVYHPESLTEAAVGTVMQFPRSKNDILSAYGVPKNLLIEFRVLSKPATVIRNVTLTALSILDAAMQRPSRDTRQVLTGPAGCGKSSVLLQAAEYCAASDWIVLYVPRAVEFVNSTTAYVYDPRTRTYIQPDASYQILRRLLSVNSEALRSLTTQEVFHMEEGQSVPAGLPLPEFIEVGLEDRSLAPAILTALMAELSRQTAYPVLFAVDDVQALYRTTLYRDPHGHHLQPHHLSFPRLMLEYASGQKSFARGAFLGAASTAHTQFQMPLELSEALGIPFPRPAGPYVKRVPEVVAYAQGLQNFPVPAELSVSEAASLFEVWMKDKALHSGEVRGETGELHSVPNDELFMSKYCEAAGNARAFVWKGLLSTLSSLT